MFSLKPSHLKRKGRGGLQRKFITVDHNSDLDHPFSAWCDEVANRNTVRQCLSLICEVLRFDIAEMWVKEAGIVRCCQIFICPEVVSNHGPSLIQNSHDSQTHHLSTTLCERADGNKGEPLWFTSTREGACLYSDPPIKTAVVMQDQVTSCKYMTFYVVCFSLNRMQFDPPILAFLRHMVKACCITASKQFDPLTIQEHDEVQELTQINGIDCLLHKEKELDLDVSWALLDDARFLVNGGFCAVYTATFKHTPVVVKMLKDDRLNTTQARTDLECEMHFLMKLKHENILEIYGAGFNPERFIILEKLDCGTLTQLQGGTSHGIGPMRRKKQSTYLEILMHARQLVSALKYLHEDAIPGFVTIHRDLKPGNIGFKMKADGNMVLKLMDFGLAKSVPAGAKEHQTYTLSGDVGSVRYMAPEVAQCLPYNEKADIYSFGIILWQMVTSKKPFDGCEVQEFKNRVMMHKERPAFTKKMPEELTSLMSQSWDFRSRLRPSAAEICARLDDMIAARPTWKDSRKGRKPIGVKGSRSRSSSMQDSSLAAGTDVQYDPAPRKIYLYNGKEVSGKSKTFSIIEKDAILMKKQQFEDWELAAANKFTELVADESRNDEANHLRERAASNKSINNNENDEANRFRERAANTKKGWF